MSFVEERFGAAGAGAAADLDLAAYALTLVAPANDVAFSVGSISNGNCASCE